MSQADPQQPLRAALLAIALIQAVSTLLGCVELLLSPQWFEPMLRGTSFVGRYGVAALLLGVVVGGPQWAALVAGLRGSRWRPLLHAVAGTVMVGWIAGECLVLDSFMWAHALWGGLGVVQLLLVLVLLGVLRPTSVTAGTTSSVAS